MLTVAFAAMWCAAPAAGRADEILARVAAGFRAMPSYGVDFEVAAGDYRTEGRYAVAGECYFLTLADAEVFADGRTRYEVDRRRREVTIVEPDASSGSLLDNPVHLFELLAGRYAAELRRERDGEAEIVLRPVAAAAGADPTGLIVVTVTTATMRPRRLLYDYDGERMEIRLRRIAPLDAPLVTFDRSRYKGYEFIDFR